MIRVVLLVCLGLIQGCAIHYTDNRGDHHIIGLVDVTLPRKKSESLEAGDSVSVTNVGGLISYGPLHSGIGIGYNKESTVILKNDTAVLLKSDD